MLLAQPRVASLAELRYLGEQLLELPPDEMRALLQAMDEANRRTVEYALGAAGIGWRADPAQWLSYLSGGLYRTRKYLTVLSAAFRRAADGVEPRQTWEIPARYGKSRLASQAGPAWLLDLDPSANLILCSYAHDLAMENALAVRDLIAGHPDQLRVRLRQDKRRKDRFGTSGGGGLIAAGVGGSITGFGAGGGELGAGGGVILDDMFKNWAEAHSETRRAAVWNFYRSVIRLRLNEERAFIIHVTTRWHQDDLNGKLDAAAVAGDGVQFTRYRLPALADSDDDLLGRRIGEPLAPDLFSLDDVLARKRDLGTYLAAAMEQQLPAPEEGGELKRAWWRWGDVPKGSPDDAVTSWDMKLKDTTTGDFVVGQAWHRYASTAWCMEQLRGQWNLVTTRTAIALMQVRHPKIGRHLVENTGNGPEVMQALRRGMKGARVDDEIAGALGMSRVEREQVERLLERGMPGLVPVSPKESKIVRTRRVAPYVEAGDVWLPNDAANGWALQLVNEAAAFPNGDHDDAVDAMSQALDKLLATGQASTSRARNARASAPRPGHAGSVRPWGRG